MVRAEDQFHVGMVVDDLTAARNRLTELFGYAWTPEIGATVAVRLPSGADEVELHLVYSVNEPRVELVQAVPDSVWQPAAGSGIHHIGYLSDDVAADAAKLEAAGFAHEATGIGPDGEEIWGYHRHPGGPRIELVSRALAAVMAALWSSG